MSQSQAGPSQVGQDPTKPEEKIWALKNCKMRILGHGKKKSTDRWMTLQLEFTFDKNPVPQIIGKYHKSKHIRNNFFGVSAVTYDDPLFKSTLERCNSLLGTVNTICSYPIL